MENNVRSNTPVWYDTKTKKIISDDIADLFETQTPKRFDGSSVAVAPKGAIIENGFVVMPKTSEAAKDFFETEQEETITNINKPRPGKVIDLKSADEAWESQIDEVLDLLHDNPQNKSGITASKGKNATKNKNYKKSKAYQKSVTEKKHSQKREKRYRYEPPKFFIAAIVVASTFAAAYNLNKAVEKMELKSYYEQANSSAQIIYSADDKSLSKTDMVERNKERNGTYDQLGNPNWHLNYEGIVEEFFDLPDITFTTNMYLLYQNFGELRYEEHPNFIGTTNLDYVVEKIASQVDGTTHPNAKRALSGCKNWHDFLEKNYIAYTSNKDKESESFYVELEKAFLENAIIQIKIDTAILNSQATELVNQNTILPTEEETVETIGGRK